MLLKLLAGTFKGTKYLGLCSERHLMVLSFEIDLAEKIGINRKGLLKREERRFSPNLKLQHLPSAVIGN